jgi:effector-binding domain-containing protein
MELQASPEFLIGQMRVLTMREMTFFYVTNQPTPFANLDRDFDTLLDKLCEAQAQANIPEAGPEITRYYKVDTGAHPGEPDLYLMEVGVSVKSGTLPAGEAQVKTLPPYHCAALVHWGSLVHIRQAYGSLTQAVKEAGLERTGECREWNFYFESGESPNDLIGLFMEVR